MDKMCSSFVIKLNLLHTAIGENSGMYVRGKEVKCCKKKWGATTLCQSCGTRFWEGNHCLVNHSFYCWLRTIWRMILLQSAMSLLLSKWDEKNWINHEYILLLWFEFMSRVCFSNSQTNHCFPMRTFKSTFLRYTKAYYKISCVFISQFSHYNQVFSHCRYTNANKCTKRSVKTFSKYC